MKKSLLLLSRVVNYKHTPTIAAGLATVLIDNEAGGVAGHIVQILRLILKPPRE